VRSDHIELLLSQSLPYSLPGSAKSCKHRTIRLNKTSNVSVMPFRNLAVQEYKSANADSMRKLAELLAETRILRRQMLPHG